MPVAFVARRLVKSMVSKARTVGCRTCWVMKLRGRLWKLAGAYPLIAVDWHDHKLKTAARYGATHTINSSKHDFVAAAREVLNRLPADVVVDGTGNSAVLEKALELAGPHARVVGVGVMPHERKLSLNTLQLHMGKVLRGSHGGESQPADDIPRILRIHRAGKLDTNG